MSCSNFNPDVPSTSSNDLPGRENAGSDDTEDSQNKKSVTILISDTGEITYDEKTLQSIIGMYDFRYLHREDLTDQ